MISSWINDAVRAFGRQMGLNGFELNERGAAGVRFENGIALYLEYADGALMMSAGVACDSSANAMKKLLAAVHPGARNDVRFRAVRMERAGEARFVARLGERDITTAVLEETFRALWQTVDYFRRAVS